jgi:oligopeptide/dipeptide ABC transporter ATP-binding protein
MSTAMPHTPAGPAAPLIEVRGLVKHFPLGHDKVVHACSDVDLTLRPGETLGVIGESGSGKTTLGRCLLRLLEPTAGTIRFEDRDITALGREKMRQLRQHLQIVFQEPFDSLNPQMTIARQVAEPLRIHLQLSRAERRDRALELMAMVGLPPGVADALPRSLSPGALQRASIARAIATEPRLIVLDEPTSALSPEAEVEIITLLESLQDRLGLAYVFISHDLSLVREICDHVAVMYLSQVVETGTRDEVFTRPRHPYSRALLASVLLPDPRHRRAIGERLEGEIPSPVDLPVGCFLASRCPYVRERCRVEPQALQAVPGAETHRSRCWRMVEGDISEAELRGDPVAAPVMTAPAPGPTPDSEESP